MARTVPFEARLDVASLATLDKYYRESGTAPRSRSDLIYMVVQDMCHLLVKAGKVAPVTSINEAVVYLEETFGGAGKPGRNARTLLSERRAEVLVEEGFTPEYLQTATKRQLTEEELQEAVAKAADLIRQTGVDTLT